MKLFTLLVLWFFIISCVEENSDYSVMIYDGNTIDSVFLQKCNIPEKAIISGYLFAYANECSSEKEVVKCDILNFLSIENECDENHISFLKGWFSEDIMVKIKLLNCPNLPSDGVIQNTIKSIELKRKKDTIKIRMHVTGLNNSQEKTWDINQTHAYLIKNNTFISLN